MVHARREKLKRKASCLFPVCQQYIMRCRKKEHIQLYAYACDGATYKVDLVNGRRCTKRAFYVLSGCALHGMSCVGHIHGRTASQQIRINLNKSQSDIFGFLSL